MRNTVTPIKYLMLFFSVSFAFTYFYFPYPIIIKNTVSAEISAPASSTLKVEQSYFDPRMDLADKYFIKRYHESALIEYKKALPIFEHEKNYQGLVTVSYRIGSCYNFLGNADSAMFYLKYSKELCYKKLNERNIAAAYVHYYFGSYYLINGMSSTALKEFNHAKLLLLQFHGKRHPFISDVLDYIGNVKLYYFKNYIAAEKNYKEALKSREQRNEINTFEAANNYYRLSIVYRMKGDFEKAFSYNKKALHLFQNFDGNFLSNISNCYNNAANIHFSMNQFAEAEENYQKAISILINQNRFTNSLLVNYYNNLGVTFSNLQKYDDCIQTIAHSIALNANRTDTLEMIKSYLNLGVNFNYLYQMDSCFFYYQKGLALSKEFYPAKHQQTSLLLREIALSYEKINQLDSALLYIQKAIVAFLNKYSEEKNFWSNPSDSMMQNSLHLLTLLNDKGKLLEKKYYQTNDIKFLETALNSYSLSDIVMKMNRNAYEREGSKLFMADVYRVTYDHTLNCAFILYNKTSDVKYGNYFFQSMEKSKSILLLESLQSMDAINNSEIPEKLRDEEKSIQSELSDIEFDLKQINNKSTNSSERKHAERLDSLKFILERKLENLKEELKEKYPSFTKDKYNIKELTITEVMNDMEPNDQILQYYYGDSIIFVMGLSNSKFRINRISNKNFLEQNIALYNKLLTSNPKVLRSYDDQEKSYKEFTETAFYLYENLVKPVAVQNSGFDDAGRLFIIPDGPLASIPFEAFIDSRTSAIETNYQKLPFLLKKYQVSYANSCNILFKKKKQSSWLKRINPLFLSYATAKDHSVEYRKNSNKESNALYLPHADQLKNIARKVGGEYCVANKINFLTKSGDHNIIHFHVHASSDRNNYLNSKLLLEHSPAEKKGDLYSHEIYKMDFKDKLIVLNACETGVGKNYRGEGIFSMARGFTYAGCNNIVMTLWKIDEDATFQLTKYFYEVLSSEYNPGKAMHLSKINYLNTHDYMNAHPALWAGWVIADNQYSQGFIFLLNYKNTIILIALVFLIIAVLSMIYVSWRKKKILKEPKVPEKVLNTI